MEKIQKEKTSKKPEIKKQLEGKEILKENDFQIRKLEDGTLMVYIKRNLKILVRILPALPKAS